MEIKKGLKKGLLEIALSTIATFSFSGCAGLLGEGGFKPVDLSKTHYASTIEEKADELSKSESIEDKADAAKGYGVIKKLKKMDEAIYQIIKKNLERGITYAGIGEKFYEFFNVERPKLEKDKEK